MASLHRDVLECALEYPVVSIHMFLLDQVSTDIIPVSYCTYSLHIIYTGRVPVQRAIERDEIPYPYKVHDTTLRPLLNITIKSTIVVRNRSRSCGGGDICGTTPA